MKTNEGETRVPMTKEEIRERDQVMAKMQRLTDELNAHVKKQQFALDLIGKMWPGHRRDMYLTDCNFVAAQCRFLALQYARMSMAGALFADGLDATTMPDDADSEAKKMMLELLDTFKQIKVAVRHAQTRMWMRSDS